MCNPWKYHMNVGQLYEKNNYAMTNYAKGKKNLFNLLKAVFSLKYLQEWILIYYYNSL